MQHVDEASQDVGRGERALELHGRLKVTKSFIIATCIMSHVENEHYSYHILTTISNLNDCNSAVETPRKLKFRL